MLLPNVGRAPITLTRQLKKLNFNLVGVRFFNLSANLNEDVSLEKMSQEQPPPGRMAAWLIHSYGNESVLTMSTMHPEPILRKPGDVKIEVLASSVNPIDHAMLGMHQLLITINL